MYLNTKAILSTGQYGYRVGHSTDLAACELVGRINDYFRRGQVAVGIFIDLSKAFDTTDHSILSHNLQYYGFSEDALGLIDSYLTN